MRKLFMFLMIMIMILPVMNYAISNGNIAGKVVDENGKAVEDASIVILQLEKGAYSGANGSFYLKDVGAGSYDVQAQLMGYTIVKKSVVVKMGETTMVRFVLKSEAVEMEGFVVSANRAVKRETPIAFTDVSKQEISNKYATQDMPQLLEDVPGLFANTTGMGDAQITMRGFSADKIQVLINGIPVNDPESQKVYWSNWTGLSSNVKSVQVQKGAGSSLYGSGAFGGSLNIETMGSTPDGELSVRSSYVSYYTDQNVADGVGSISEYNPQNYNVITSYNSGNLFGGLLNVNAMLEKKKGDYYLNGTNYDGYSYSIESQITSEIHKFNVSFLGAPQSHNQNYFKSDPKLFETLGRAYNRNNHEYQENYYFKPQVSFRDEWQITDDKLLMTNFFITKGNGGGKYISADKFDVKTGEVHWHDGFMDSDDPAGSQFTEFSKHALYLYEEYGLEVEGFNSSDSTYYELFDFWLYHPSYHGQEIVGAGKNFFRSRYNYTWRNNSISDHFQYGGNTYFQYDINEAINFVTGGEYRKWEANHSRKRENFRYFDPTSEDSLNISMFENFQTDYDYDSKVENMSVFVRTKIKPTENLNIMIDGQYANYTSSISENPIELYDFSTGEGTEHYFYATKEMKEVVGQDTVLKFSEEDYSKTFKFFSPKVGVNYNISEYFNVLVNWSLAYKEPKTRDWYSGFDGPDGNQMYSQDMVGTNDDGSFYEYSEDTFFGELKSEKINTYELGIGYDGVNIDFDANYYISDYEDKIERVDVPVTHHYVDQDSLQNEYIATSERDETLTLNAGKARHQGLEFSTKAKWRNIDAAGSLTLAHNRWVSMNVTEVFGGSAEDMIGKVVPFSPEKMLNGSLGYTFNDMPFDGKFRIGLSSKYWDDYYATYTNDCVSDYVWDETANEGDGAGVPVTEYYVDNDGNYYFDDMTTEYVEFNDPNVVPDGVSIYGNRIKMKSSKLNAFFELNANMKYSCKIFGKESSIRLDLNNILNKNDNYLSAIVKKDYNRGYYDTEGVWQDDYLTGNENLYVTPSPLINLFLTMEVKF